MIVKHDARRRLEVTDRNQSSNPVVISRQYYWRSRQRDSYQNIINYLQGVQYVRGQLIKLDYQIVGNWALTEE